MSALSPAFAPASFVDVDPESFARQFNRRRRAA